GDRNGELDNAKATFVMSNMVPQTMDLNGGAWNDLEIYCRHLVKNHEKELYIVAGPAGKGGRSTKGFFNTIAGGKGPVPGKCWKVTLVVDKGDGTPLERAKESARLIAVVMPNDRTPTGSTPDTKWWKYRVSVKDVEELTGLTFFDKIGTDEFKALKEEVDDE